MLLAVENNNRRMWAVHHLALEEGRHVIIPSVVVAQAWRDPRRQAQLGRFLRSCEVLPLGFETAKSAGMLCGSARTADIVDATVVTVALACGAIVFTSDPNDIAELAAAAQVKPGLVVRRV
ncbi:hypothetical protein OG958_11175 [Micromonospora sp. NBC_01813]|nr:hypothetical protein OG958_11175 [Micromonospora sp. NBC_01813]